MCFLHALKKIKCFNHHQWCYLLTEGETFHKIFSCWAQSFIFWLQSKGFRLFHWIYKVLCSLCYGIVQELCESWGGCPGLSVLMSRLVSVDVKLYWTMLRHWSQLVPNMSTDIWGHSATTYLHTCYGKMYCRNDELWKTFLMVPVLHYTKDNPARKPPNRQKLRGWVGVR